MIQIEEQKRTDALFVEDDLGPDEFDVSRLDTTGIETSPKVPNYIIVLELLEGLTKPPS